MKHVNGFQHWQPLGYFLNISPGKFYIVYDKIKRIQMVLHSFLTQLQNQQLSIVPANFAASVVGLIISTQLVLGKIIWMKTRALHKYIDSRLSWESPVFISENLLMSFFGATKYFSAK